MNANPKFLAATAEVDSAVVAAAQIAQGVRDRLAARHPRAVPRDRAGRHAHHVRRREEPAADGLRLQRPLHDPDAKIDIRRGLPELRRAWIEERGDTELLAGPTSDYGRNV